MDKIDNTNNELNTEIIPEIKRVTLHPLTAEGETDLEVNLYPKTLLDGIVDREGKAVEVQEKLISGKTIKTINGESVLGSGNIEIVDAYTKEESNEKFLSKEAATETYETIIDANEKFDDLKNNKVDKKTATDNLYVYSYGRLNKMLEYEEEVMVSDKTYSYTIPIRTQNGIKAETVDEIDDYYSKLLVNIEWIKNHVLLTQPLIKSQNYDSTVYQIYGHMPLSAAEGQRHSMQYCFDISSTANGNSIAQYNSNGILKSQTPEEELDVANKQYVDDKLIDVYDAINNKTSLTGTGDIHLTPEDGYAVNIDSPIWHKGTIYPFTTDTYSLGSSDYRYSNIFANQFSIANGTTTWTVENDQYNEMLINSQNGTRIVDMFDTGLGSGDIRGMYLGGNLVAPLDDGVLDLGQSGRRFKSLFIKDLNVDVGKSEYYASFTTKQTNPKLLFNYDGGHIEIPVRKIVTNPSTDNVEDLATSTIRFRNLYLAGNLSDGTNSISIANIQNKITITDNGDNTVDITIPVN